MKKFKHTKVERRVQLKPYTQHFIINPTPSTTHTLDNFKNQSPDTISLKHVSLTRHSEKEKVHIAKS